MRQCELSWFQADGWLPWGPSPCGATSCRWGGGRGGASPPLLTYIVDILGSTLVVEPLFFYAHWALHHPKLYGKGTQISVCALCMCVCVPVLPSPRLLSVCVWLCVWTLRGVCAEWAWSVREVGVGCAWAVCCIWTACCALKCLDCMLASLALRSHP